MVGKLLTTLESVCGACLRDPQKQTQSLFSAQAVEQKIAGISMKVLLRCRLDNHDCV